MQAKTKVLIILLIALINFSSCGSKKKIQECHSTEQYSGNLEKIIDQISKEKKYEIDTSVINESLLITIIEYDTDKPIDPETGKPPIKKETNIEKNKNEERDKTEETKLETQTREEISGGFEIQKDKTDRTEEKRSESKWSLYLSAGIVMILLIVLLVFFWRLGLFNNKN